MRAPDCQDCGEPMHDTGEVLRHWHGRHYAETTVWGCDGCGIAVDQWELDRDAEQAAKDEHDNRRIDAARDREYERRRGCEE